jgi:hypothetical protein
MGMHAYFLGVVLSMDTSTACYFSYIPLGLGKPAPLSYLHYVQPQCPPTIYLVKGSALWTCVGSAPFSSTFKSRDPVLVEDDGSLAPVQDVVATDSPAPNDATPYLPSFTSIVP